MKTLPLKRQRNLLMLKRRAPRKRSLPKRLLKRQRSQQRSKRSPKSLFLSLSNKMHLKLRTLSMATVRKTTDLMTMVMKVITPPATTYMKPRNRGRRKRLLSILTKPQSTTTSQTGMKLCTILTTRHPTMTLTTTTTWSLDIVSTNCYTTTKPLKRGSMLTKKSRELMTRPNLECHSGVSTTPVHTSQGPLAVEMTLTRMKLLCTCDLIWRTQYS